MKDWNNFEKLHTALKYYMVGRGYYTGLKAMHFAQRYHTGMRKDGITKEFMHQIEIAFTVSTLKSLVDEEKTMAAALLHDVMEDYNIPRSVMESEFGEDLTHIVWLLTKKYNGIEKDKDTYFDAISNNPFASIVKGVDRVHNIQTMVGVFKLEKQKKYIDEVKNFFLPMLKKGRFLFAEQGAAYANVEHTLRSQIALIKAIHNAIEHE